MVWYDVSDGLSNTTSADYFPLIELCFKGLRIVHSHAIWAPDKILSFERDQAIRILNQNIKDVEFVYLVLVSLYKTFNNWNLTRAQAHAHTGVAYCSYINK